MPIKSAVSPCIGCHLSRLLSNSAKKFRGQNARGKSKYWRSGGARGRERRITEYRETRGRRIKKKRRRHSARVGYMLLRRVECEIGHRGGNVDLPDPRDAAELLVRAFIAGHVKTSVVQNREQFLAAESERKVRGEGSAKIGWRSVIIHFLYKAQ